tara:strand:- start:16 stop:1176 length:1161 start_codon:yes stop_codon:yes gene_type:complete
MAKKENVVEEVVELVEETNAPTEKTEQGDLVPEVTVKEDGTHKIDFDKLVAKPEKGKVAKEEVKEEVKVEEPVTVVEEEVVPKEPTVLEEITEEKIVEKAEEIAEAVVEAQETGRDLPENIQKVVDFMDETGGSLEDYVKLNTDIEALNEEQLLMEYYQNTKPHLDVSEINFLLEDKFSYEDEVDEERDIKRKKLAKKEELANAKNHLNGLKTKYYEEIKAGSKLAPEQKKAVDFFNRYNKNQEVADKQTKTFNNKTNQVFNDDFKGFEYNVGDKRYRFNVKNPNEIKDKQGNINNFVKKFLDKNNEMEDAAGYHKSLFTAMNPDAIANHFYEQGKSDAMRQSIASTKNISMDPRKSQGAAPKSGTTYKSVDSDGSTVNWGFKKRK